MHEPRGCGRSGGRGLDADLIVVGAGAIGVSTAYHAAEMGLRVRILEKEDAPARHQSGRNSGVIHPGYNPTPGSLKARFCVEGSRRLRAYCAKRGVRFFEGGILVVALDEAQRPTLRELHSRGEKNGARTRILDGSQIQSVEPEAAGIEALHAPEGASFDAEGYVNALLADARELGVEVEYGATVRAIHDGAEPSVSTSRGRRTARVVVNAAGLYSDRLAGEIARDLRILPFRGYYAELKPEARPLVRSHIYDAPDLAFPFLGVHLSRRADGRVIAGPGAMLAFGREAYEFHQFSLRDLGTLVAWPGAFRLLARPEFRRLIRSEVGKSISLDAIHREARALVPTLRSRDLVRSYAGNRAQLVDREGNMVDDIVVREGKRTLHVLNAVSPGLTCSLPFGESLGNRAADVMGGL